VPIANPSVEVLRRPLESARNLPVGVVEQIVARTDGVPLFLEELTKAVLEAGAGEGPAATPPIQRLRRVWRLLRVPSLHVAGVSGLDR